MIFGFLLFQPWLGYPTFSILALFPGLSVPLKMAPRTEQQTLDVVWVTEVRKVITSYNLEKGLVLMQPMVGYVNFKGICHILMGLIKVVVSETLQIFSTWFSAKPSCSILYCTISIWTFMQNVAFITIRFHFIGIYGIPACQNNFEGWLLYLLSFPALCLSDFISFLFCVVTKIAGKQT